MEECKMKNLFICYPKCSTCQKAEKWLKENKIEYEKRNIVEENPNKEELKKYSKILYDGARLKNKIGMKN